MDFTPNTKTTPTSFQLPNLEDRIIGEFSYDDVVSCISFFDLPLEDWNGQKLLVDLKDGTRIRFSRKQFMGIKRPVCVHCGERGVKFIIVTAGRPKINPRRNCQKPPKALLATQHNVLLTRDHIVPKCQGGGNELSNLQVLCELCNNQKSKEDVHPR